MKKQLSTFVKGAAVVVPLSGVIPQGEGCAWFGENFFKNILWYLGYLNPVYWWKCYFSESQLEENQKNSTDVPVDNKSSKEEKKTHENEFIEKKSIEEAQKDFDDLVEKKQENDIAVPVNNKSSEEKKKTHENKSIEEFDALIKAGEEKKIEEIGHSSNANNQGDNQKNAVKKDKMTSEVVIEKLKKLCKGEVFVEHTPLPGVCLKSENSELLLQTHDHEYSCKKASEEIGWFEETAYRVCFEKDRVNFCTGKNKEVIYSISFEDPDFDGKLIQLSDHLRQINAFLKKLESDLKRNGGELIYKRFLCGEIRLGPEKEMRVLFGDKSLEKLEDILISTDYHFVTLVTQNNDKSFIKKDYDLFNPENAKNLFLVYSKFRKCEEDDEYDEYDEYAFNKGDIVLEKDSKD